MARLKPPKPPTAQQMARCGIDTLCFTHKQVVTEGAALLPWLRTYIDSSITAEHLTLQPGNGFYKHCVSISISTEDPAEFSAPYKGTAAELLRIYFSPRPKSAGALYSNDTTLYCLNGELLRRINYMSILEWIRDNDASVTRLDLYKDDFSYLLNLNLLHHLCSVSSYTNHVQSPLVKSYLDIHNGENSIYLGHPRGKQIHIYNKALQTGEKFQHVRAEIKLRKDNKLNTGIVCAIANGEPMEPLISSILSKYITFKPAGTGRIHDRQPYAWWAQFLASSTPIKRQNFLPILPPKTPKIRTYEDICTESQQLQALLQQLEMERKQHPDCLEF